MIVRLDQMMHEVNMEKRRQGWAPDAFSSTLFMKFLIAKINETALQGQRLKSMFFSRYLTAGALLIFTPDETCPEYRYRLGDDFDKSLLSSIKGRRPDDEDVISALFNYDINTFIPRVGMVYFASTPRKTPAPAVVPSEGDEPPESEQPHGNRPPKKSSSKR